MSFAEADRLSAVKGSAFIADPMPNTPSTSTCFRKRHPRSKSRSADSWTMDERVVGTRAPERSSSSQAELVQSSAAGMLQ